MRRNLLLQSMLLIPYRRFQLDSPLSPAQVGAVLAELVEPARWIRVGAGTRPFEGTVEQGTFRMRPLIRYRNSFISQIHGHIEAAQVGSRIIVTMKLHPVALVFMAVWLWSTLMIGVIFAATALAGRSSLAALLVDGRGGVLVIPMGMFVFGWGMMVGGFAIEATKATQLLTDAFKARRAS